MKNVSIIGAGLAGCEAALQLAMHNFNVTLYDLKPEKILTAYRLSSYAELVCNNSIGNISKETPLGLLLEELKILRSNLILIAEKCRIDDPGFFAINKKMFSQNVTKKLYYNNINIINKRVSKIPDNDYVIIASGPLTDEELIRNISIEYGIEEYHFSDASSPVLDIRTVNIENSNVRKITNDLFAISIPMPIFESFCYELVKYSEQTKCNDFDKSIEFEKCKSIEKLALSGVKELYFKRFDYSFFNVPCLLLRRENALENAFILVGCTTMLRNSEQIKAFSMIPGLERCKFIKYGRMHRNTFINAPKILNEFFQIRETNTFIIGQLSGVDGYTAAIASGLVAAFKIIYGDALLSFPQSTIIGALAHYISNPHVTDFQPMCASFYLMNCKKDFYRNSIKSLTKYLNQLPKSESPLLTTI